MSCQGNDLSAADKRLLNASQQSVPNLFFIKDLKLLIVKAKFLAFLSRLRSPL